jgi:hypothetical protein
VARGGWGDLGGHRKEKPGAADSHTWFPWLRETRENSNFVLVKIPIEINNVGHGQKRICMDSKRLPEELGLTAQGIESLSQVGLIRRLPSKAC